MGSLAVSRLASDDTLPPLSIADQVAAMARKELAPHALAIDEGNFEHVADELGDVLLQVALHAVIGEEYGRDFND